VLIVIVVQCVIFVVCLFASGKTKQNKTKQLIFPAAAAAALLRGQ